MTQRTVLLFTFLFIFIGCGFVSAPAVSARDAKGSHVQEVIGTGIIHLDNVAKARDEAIKQGLWEIVERGVEEIVPLTAIVSHFQLLNDRVYSRPEEFIHNYRVLTESKSGRHYRVVVRATVMTDTLQKTLKEIGVLLPEKVMPNILLLLMEQNVGVVGYVHSWDQASITKFPLTIEQTLDRFLTKKGFSIIRPGKPLSSGSTDESYNGGGELSDDVAMALGKQVGAEVIVIGVGVARLSTDDMEADTKTIQATFTARALRGADGAMMGEFIAMKAASDVNQMIAGVKALEAAAEAVARDLHRTIAARWDRRADKTVLVEMSVRGIDVYGDFVRFRKVLRNEVSGIKNVYLKAIKAGEAKIDIELQGNTQRLSEELMRKRFGGFRVNIIEIGEKHIQLELAPTSQPAAMPQVNQEGTPSGW